MNLVTSNHQPVRQVNDPSGDELRIFIADGWTSNFRPVSNFDASFNFTGLWREMILHEALTAEHRTELHTYLGDL